MKVAALVPYHTDFCAGQRFRIELWGKHLERRGINVEYFPFASRELTTLLYRDGLHFAKAQQMLRCYVDQLHRILSASPPDIVFIYREASLIGPAWIERLASRWKAPVVYDIDEPIFVSYLSPRNGRLNVLKCVSKTHSLFKMSNHVLAVNKAIGDYASRFTKRVSIVPMAVDLDRYYPVGKDCRSLPVRIGWVGTLTNQPNLEIIAEPLAKLRETRGANMRVIADEHMSLAGLEIEFIPWSYDHEVRLLQECQIGVVPVKDTPWSRWKFFFKLIQYMSLGLPVVATPTGSNIEIIEHGVNGFLADSEEEWYRHLLTLIDNPDLRVSMGRAARRTVEKAFNLEGQIDFVESVFREQHLLAHRLGTQYEVLPN